MINFIKNIGRDKKLHFIYSFIIAFLGGVFAFILRMNTIQFIFTSFSLSMATGLGKEYADHINPNNKWDWYDIFADVLGAITGTAASSVLLFI